MKIDYEGDGVGRNTKYVHNVSYCKAILRWGIYVQNKSTKSYKHGII